VQQHPNLPASERPLSERLAKWQRTWRRIAERVFNEDSRVQAAQEIESEVNGHESNHHD
jgi:hypothetical protein